MAPNAHNIQTCKQIDGKRLHLHQIVTHRVPNEDAPTEINSENLISDEIFLDQVEWIITSLKGEITLTRPGFNKESVIYTEDYLRNNINKFTPQTENSIPVYGY